MNNQIITPLKAQKKVPATMTKTVKEVQSMMVQSKLQCNGRKIILMNCQKKFRFFLGSA